MEVAQVVIEEDISTDTPPAVTYKRNSSPQARSASTMDKRQAADEYFSYPYV